MAPIDDAEDEAAALPEPAPKAKGKAKAKAKGKAKALTVAGEPLPAPRVFRYPKPTGKRHLIGWVTVSLFTTGLVLIPVLCINLFYLCCRNPQRWIPYLAVLCGLHLWPFHSKWAAWERMWKPIFEIWCEIFETTLIYENGEEPHPTDFMMMVHPHGVIPIVGMLIWGSTMSHGLHPEHFGASGAALGIPFFKQFLTWNGGVSASRKDVSRTVKWRASFSIFSGGIREMVACDPTKEILVLKKRIGVTQIAKEHSKAIVPVFAFGASQHFKRWPSPDACGGGVNRMSNRFRMAFLVPYGWLGLPIPLFARTTIVFGRPIKAAVGESTQDLHKRWTDWYPEAYERYKEAAGCANRELVIT